MQRTLIFALVLTALILLPVFAVAQQEGMILYLPLGEGDGNVVMDQSGNGNDGELSGGPKWVAGKNGQGLYLDGEDDYIELANILTEAGTIEFWFKPDWDGSDPEDYRLFDAGTGIIYFFIAKGANHADINLEDFGFYFEDASDADWQDIEFNPDGVIVAGQWYHIAATWEFGGGSAFLYVNGEQMAKGANILGDFPVLNPNMRFGLEVIVYVASRNGAKGVIDDIAVYNRALTIDEIAMDMEGLGFAVEPVGKAASVWGDIKSR